MKLVSIFKNLGDNVSVLTDFHCIGTETIWLPTAFKYKEEEEGSLSKLPGMAEKKIAGMFSLVCCLIIVHGKKKMNWPK